MKKRNYAKEYKQYHSKPKAKKQRARNNAANRSAGTYGNGDGKDIAHSNLALAVEHSNKAHLKIGHFHEQRPLNVNANMPELSEDQIKLIREEERFKTSVISKLDQISADILSIKSDLNKKMDKVEFTDSWEPRLTRLEVEIDKLHIRLDNAEKFQSKLIGIGMGSGALGSGLTILTTYILSKFN